MMYKVCRVLANGDVVCTSDQLDDADLPPAKRTTLQSEFAASFPGNWGPNKFELAIHLLSLLGKSQLPDANIENRQGQIVGSVAALLSTMDGTDVPEEPTSLLLFNFSDMPAQALGPWVLARKGRAALDDLYEDFPGGDPW